MSKKVFRVLAVLMILGLLLGAMGPLVLSFDSNDEYAESEATGATEAEGGGE